MKESEQLDKDILKKENLEAINGGEALIVNGNGNIVAAKVPFEKFLETLNKLDEVGKLDYLKKEDKKNVD